MEQRQLKNGPICALRTSADSPRHGEQDEYKNVGEACRAGGLTAGRDAPGWSGCGRGGAHFGSELGAIPVPCQGGSGTLDLLPAPCPVLPPHLPSPLPLLNFSSSRFCTSRSFFSFSSTPRPRQHHCAATTTQQPHHDSRFTYTGQTRSAPVFYSTLSRGTIRFQPCMLAARASLLRGRQTLSSPHPIRHGSRPPATTRFPRHHNASQSPTPPRPTVAAHGASCLSS
ncbi:hypothetical protein VTI74DRAFT_5619 [Chaetomium olivicolor]